MIDSARKSGLDDTSQLNLIMDNASIHKGKIVSEALRAVSNQLLFAINHRTCLQFIQLNL